IDDQNYRETVGEKYQLAKPAEVPPGAFDSRLALERHLIRQEMRASGMIVGMRSLELIRPDLLAVTIDAAVSDGPGLDETAAKTLQNPSRFSVVTADTSLQPQHPAQVGRQSYLFTTADIGRFPVNPIFWHVYYLRLAEPLRSGSQISVRVSDLASGLVSALPLTFQPQTMITPTLKVNQAAYCAAASRRYAYLGWWAGDLGAVDFSSFNRFAVIDEKNGTEVLAGAITPRPATTDSKLTPAADGSDPLSGERVFQIDLSPLKPGRYHLLVPGLGRSWSFGVGGDDAWQLARTTLRGLLTQRCGCDLPASATSYPRPACHVNVYQHGRLVGGVNERRTDGKLVVANAALSADEPIRSFHGGYHDAGDFDLFSGHLVATARMLNSFEVQPNAWRDGDLNLPESGNGIPDLLDEAAWGLAFYADNQAEDGSVPAGRGNDEDYQNKEWIKDGGKEHGAIPRFGVFPPTRAATATFAAVAAQFARLVAPFDATKAAMYRERAERAWTWATKDGGGDYRNKGLSYARYLLPRCLAWAATELWETTSKPEYHAFVMTKRADPETWATTWQDVGELGYFQWPFARATQAGTDVGYQQELRAAIIKQADGLVALLDRPSYRMSSRTDGAGGWGNLVGGGNRGGLCLYAWFLTRDVKYLDAASLNADYQLGCNPLGRSFITGVGSRPPIHPELRPWLYDKNDLPAPGVPVYGPGGGPKSLRGSYPEAVPTWRCWLDNPVSELHSEFDLVRMGTEAGFHALLWIAGKDVR
ncbi:MAG: glycoside hydrolase family 9 protein, partial [Planctomycetota bacterium]